MFSIFGDVHVSDSSFEDNLATTTAGGTIAGGAIASVLGNADINYSRFFNNAVDAGGAVGFGGAVSAAFGGKLGQAIPGTIVVSHSQFIGNSVNSDVEARGGAIGAGFEASDKLPFLMLDVTVDHSQFVNNSAEGPSAQGGAI